MTSQAPTIKPAEIATLICYHRQRDAALGITADTSFVRGLASYGLFTAQLLGAEQAETYASAAYWNGILTSTKERIEKIIREANTPEKRRKALEQVTGLQTVVENAAKQLKALEDIT